MPSITGLQLKERLEKAMVDWGCKRNDYLCLGKNTQKIDQALKIIYPHWSITDQCELTEDEINCIVNRLKKYCDFRIPRKTELQRVEPTDAAVIADELTVILTQIWDSCPTPTLNGQYTLTAETFGGTAPYTYLWDCVPTGIPNAICISNPQNTGNVNTLTLPTAYQTSLKIKVTVTDSLGVVVEKEVLFNTKEDPCY